MEEVLLNKILTRVEQIGTDLTGFKAEMHEFRDEMYVFKEEMYKFRDEMYAFKDEVYKLSDQDSKETAIEINELAELISKKFSELRNDIQKRFNLNNKDHKIYEAQIEKLQISNNYIESKIHI